MPETKQLMDVWVTQHALTNGILHKQVERTHTDRMVVTDGRFKTYHHKPHWHESYPDALKQANKMRAKKIASLRRQLKRLETMTFPEEPERDNA